MKKVIVTRDMFYCEDMLFTDWYKCSNCGNTHIAEGYAFCPDCGSEVKWELADTI